MKYDAISAFFCLIGLHTLNRYFLDESPTRLFLESPSLSLVLIVFFLYISLVSLNVVDIFYSMDRRSKIMFVK